MKLRLLTVGKIKAGSHRNLAEDYIGKIGHYLPLEYTFAKKEEDVLKRIGPDDFLVICDERGREMTSEGFAGFLEERQIRSTRYLTFVIGPAEGLTSHVKDKADLTLSFSRFTIQHDLAVLVLLEQLYRACMIIRGEPYHR